MVFRAGFWVGGKCRLCVGAGCACRQVLVVGLVAARVCAVAGFCVEGCSVGLSWSTG